MDNLSPSADVNESRDLFMAAASFETLDTFCSVTNRPQLAAAAK